MAVNITATRTTTLFTDQDLDGVFDPGDIVLTRIRITNLGDTDATGISVTDTLNGVTLVPGSVQVTPIAFDDFMPSITGNTPITFTAAQLLGNDVDPDGAEINITITGVSNATNGAIVNNGDGTYTFTPTTGFAGAASFQYTITDEQSLSSVTTGVVSFTVTDPVWYVDASYTGVNGASDGSYLKPFTTLANLSTGGSADALDNADDTIFVYNSGAYTTGIVLEAGQKLFGDGHAFVVNGLTIGANASNTTIGHAGIGVMLATDNTVMGVTLNGTANGAVGVEDGGVSVGTFTMDESSITGLGKAVDIDNGGTLAVDLDQLSSASSTSEGVHLQGVGGSFNAATGTIQTSTGTGVLIGAAGGGTPSSGGDVNFTYGGDITSPGGSAVEIQDRTGGTATFTGAITEGSIAAGTTGILVDGSAGTVNFNGQTFVSAGGLGGNGVTLTNNSGTINFLATGTGLDITTATGSGLTFTGGGTLNITGAANSVVTGTGQILNLIGSVVGPPALGTSGIAFQTLTSGNVAAGNAINIVNMDAAGAGTFSGGAVTIGGTAGASADGINIAGSNATFTFASATIDNTQGDGIEINGLTPNINGAVTFTTVNIDGVGGAGVNIMGATNAVNIDGGSIGSTNDPAGDGVRITGGTGAVTVAASVTQSSGGNQVVDISTHGGGAITFSGAITANLGGGGIAIIGNTGGNINFTGDTTINTGTLAGITFTNTGATGANVTFSEGSLDIDTTSGTGINATNSTIGAGSLTISGATGVGNIISSTTGRAINIDGVTANITLNEVNVSGGGTTTGVFLQNTGSGGQFVVTGDGSTAGSGGTITTIGGGDLGSITAQATTGTGIYMNNVSNVSLSNMFFGTAATTMNNFGIRGDNVNNFTLRDSEFRGAFGTNFNFDEAAIRFGSQNVTTGLTGTALFEGNTIAGGIEDNLAVYVYGSNTLNLTVRDNATSGDQAVFGLNDTTNGNDGFYLESGGTSNVTVNVTGVAFNGARGDLMQVLSTGSTTQTIVIQNNQFINAHTNIISGGGGIAITGGGTNINIDYLVDGNTFKGQRASAIFSSYGGVSGNISGLVTNNTQGTANGVYDTSQANRGSMEGMFFFGGIDAKQTGSTGNVNYALRIEGNTIRDVNGVAGILLRSNQQDAGGQARLEATIHNNTMAEMGPNIAGGIYMQPGGASLNNDKGTIGANISNNNINFTIGGASASGDAVVFDQAGTPATFYMPGYTSAPSANPNTLAAFLTGPKGNTFTNAQVSGTGGVLANTSAVNNQAFVLTVPSAMAPGFSQGWEDLAVSPVTAPPRDPDPATPDTSGDGGGGGGSGGTGGGSGGDGGGGGGGSDDPEPPVGDDGIITLADLSSLVDAAIQRWIDAGATAAQVDAMRAVQFGIVDMAGIYVGTSDDGIINIDSDGAGYGWFVDSTPGEDSEFNGSGTRLTADADGAAAGRLDLLTVLMHELGHQIGLDDEYVTSEGDDVMFGYMRIGERRLPADGEADGAVPGSVGATAFALTPVAIGTLPPNKTVDVFFKATINAQTDGYLVNPANTSTISGSNFTDVLAQETVTLDGLTLANLVFLDVNKDGNYDAGTDSGVVGVSVSLYADTNDSGGWDSGDALIDTKTTLAGGLYSFSNLAPGDYIVVVNASNFGAGQPLQNRVSVAGGTDPDDNVDNDDNGISGVTGLGVAIASQTITLSAGAEPIDDGDLDADTNNSLDFGFIAPNAAPTSTNLDGDIAEYIEGAAPVKLDVGGNATLGDDNANFAGGTLTVAIGAGADTTDDVLSIGTTATVTLDAGNVVKVGGTAIGTYAGGTGGSPLVITLNSSANAGNVDDLLRALQYNNTDTVNPSNDTRAVSITLVDGAGNDGGLGADTLVINSLVNVTDVNDEPAGADNGDTTPDSVTLVFDAANFNTGFSDPDGNIFAGVVITTLPPAAQGKIQLNSVDISAGQFVTLTELNDGDLTFVPVSGGGASTPTFTFQVRDNGGVLNSGQDTDQSPNTFTITITPSNAAPAVDLDADGGGTGFASAYTEGGAAAAISDTDVSISDVDVGDDIVSATITITNAETGDKLNVGALPGTVTVDGTSTDTMVKLVAAPGTSAADFEAAIEAVTFSSTSDDPTDGGTNTARTITVTVNDGDSESVAATATVTITDDNADAPSGTSSTITATEDSFRLIEAVDLGFSDVDGTFAGVTISAVTGGGLYFDADGTAGGGAPVLVVLPQTYTAQDLIDGKVSFKASQDLNGAGVGTITFAVTDDDGNTDATANTLTVDVSAVNDSPVLTTGGPIAATEQTAVAILPAGSVADVDLDARNGGNGDYAGASFSVNRNPATNPTEDDFTLVAGPNFTIDGSNLEAGGLIFGTISVDGTAGLIVINFTSLETAATSALVDEVMQGIRYTNNSDTPPASVDLAVGFDDGSPGGGQGAGATDLDVNLVTVNITAVDDPPVVTLADATVSGTEDVDLVFEAANGNAITVADIDSASLTVTLTVLNGKLTLSQTTGLAVTGDGTATVELTGSAVDINAALEGLVYRGNLNHEGSDTLSVEADDGTSTDTENVAITLADDGIIHGDTGPNTLTGTPGPDLFFVQQGNDDTVYGLAGDDIFYFGAAFDGDDTVDGDGGGKDVVVLQGNYTQTLSITNLTDVESLSLKSGAFTNYGDLANNFYDYDITTVDENVAAGAQLIVNGSSLRVGEDFTFDGSAETDGKFVVLGGHGVDTLTGGDGNDIFIFDGTRWGASDTVDGGLGRDSVVITAGNGLTHIEFGATSLIGIDSVTVSNTYSSTPTATPDYEFVLDDGNVAAGETLIVNGFTLADPGQTISIDGSDESDGKLILFGGAGNDVLIGGDGADTLYGAGRGDTLTGGAGNDVFRYDKVTDSDSTERDGIQDFNVGDLIDLSRIDADSTQDGNQAFSFIGNAAFNNVAGELRFENISLGGPIWLVQGDTDGNGVSDFEVVLVITVPDPITSGDFIL